MKYINLGDIKDDFLLCSALETTTKADDGKKLTPFQDEDLQWENVCGVCTDRVYNEDASTSRKGINCMIH